MNMKLNYLLLCLFLLICIIDAKTYKGAELRTIDAYTYGRFETRYKRPQAEGYLASFFTYHNITVTTTWNEIDVEILGRYDNDVQVTSIGPGQTIRKSHQLVTFNPGDNFHTYAFEWTPNYIAWFIDDVETYRQTGAFISDFQYPQKMMMNIWPPVWTNWVGTLDPNSLPLFAVYEYASYASYTPGSGNIGTNNDFTLQWTDEFDNWNQSRWEKSTHTFGGNDCDFVAENAVFQNGQLILCLTQPSDLGYVDNTPPSGSWARGLDSTITVHFTEKVDSVTSQVTTNYLINGVTVIYAVLQADQQTVILNVTGLDTSLTYNVILRNVQDLLGNAMSVQVMSLHIINPLTFPIKINVGGEEKLGFKADSLWDPTQEYGHEDGIIETWDDSIGIGNTGDDEIYRDALHDVVNYKIRVPNGQYRVTLLLCENNADVISEPRIMSIYVEEIKIVNELNLCQTAGLHYAYDLIADNISVVDGIIDIHFTNLWNLSLLNGIIVEQVNTGFGHKEELVPHNYILNQNFPNPFNPMTKIVYSLRFSSSVVIQIFDTTGRIVDELINKKQLAGTYEISFDGKNLASGIYFYRLCVDSESKNEVLTKKMILIK